MSSFRIGISFISTISWLLTMMQIGQKLYPESSLAEISFGAAGMMVGILIGLSIEYVVIALREKVK